MLHTGLCSITFRQHSIDDIIRLCKEAGVDGIEWGSDVHVLPGNIELAKSVKAKTEAAGLRTCSYGSYYRCTDESGSISEHLETADALEAPAIRVWAGDRGSDCVDQNYRDEIAERLRRMIIAAKELNITVALEYHGDTLTDTQASAHQLLNEVNLPDLKLYWQPRTGGDFETDLVELNAALPHLSHVHCFHWGKGGWKDRYPLLDGTQDWAAYLDLIRKAPSDGDRYIILEFIKDDSPQQFIEDAQVLRSLIHS